MIIAQNITDKNNKININTKKLQVVKLQTLGNNKYFIYEMDFVNNN